MADRSKSKESTPPPLLLMPASEGLTFSTGQASNFLVPVCQGEPSLISSDDVGEADSFLGQSPPKGFPHLNSAAQQGQGFGLFQGQTSGPPRTDPFSGIQQPPLMQGALPMSQGAPPMMSGAPATMQGPPSALAGVPPPGTGFGGPSLQSASAGGLQQHSTSPQGPPPAGQSSANYHRMSGRPKYAQPPAGTYADTAQNQGFGPGPQQFSPPSSVGVPPPMSVNVAAPAFQPGPPPMGGAPSSNIGPPPTMGGPPPPSSTMFSPGLYIPIQYHWFYCQSVELRQVWKPFSIADSIKLEEGFKSGAQVVSTDGGRYDVDLPERSRTAIYWDDSPSKVRRASWFNRPEGDSRFVPYEEDFAERLEEIYEKTLGNGEWHRRHEFPNGDVIVMHNPNVVVSFRASAQPDEWGNTQGDMRPRVVKRGVEDFDEIQDGEPNQIDHVVFVVHGIGPTCDLRFRNIIECVDDFRKMSLQMGKSHFGQYQDEGRIGRVEFLPVRWHQALHGDATGVDRRLKAITLKSIAKLRHFTNDTLLDILFYASPTYAQQIAETVGKEINRLSDLFSSRNPDFQGSSSVVGHSLGSLILFDLLVHQHDPNYVSHDTMTSPGTTVQTHAPSSETSQPSRDSTPSKELTGETGEDEVETIDDLLLQLNLTDYSDTFRKEEMDLETLTMCEDSDIKEMGIPLGPRKKIQRFVEKHKHRKTKRKDEEKAVPEIPKPEQDTSQSNLSSSILSEASTHDPLLRSASNTSVTYMMGVAGTGVPFVQYPQLRFNPVNFFALGSPISMFLTVRGLESLGDEFHFPTCPGFFNIFHPFDPVAYRIEPLLLPVYPPKPSLVPHHKGRKRLHLELKESIARMGTDIKHKMIHYIKNTWQTINDFALAHRKAPQEMLEQEVDSVMSQMSHAEDDTAETESMISSQMDDDIHTGSLNQGRRVDFVLQEKPIESFNDYLFALGSHMTYWESEDTVLLILKEVYGQMGISPIRPGNDGMTSPLGPPPAHGPPAFPRHPMAPSGGPNIPHAAQMVTPPGGHFSRPQVPPGGGYMNQQMTGGFATQPGVGAPPPLTGFVRKS